MSIYKKISEFQSLVGAIRKDSKNPHFKSKYASIESVLDAIREPLKKCGLAIVQQSKSDGLVTVLADIETGQEMTSFVPYILAKQDMQGLGSAITYARRYGLVSILGLEQEDDDANIASNLAPKQTAKISEQQFNILTDLIIRTETDEVGFCGFFKIPRVVDLKSDDFARARAMLEKKLGVKKWDYLIIQKSFRC